MLTLKRTPVLLVCVVVLAGCGGGAAHRPLAYVQVGQAVPVEVRLSPKPGETAAGTVYFRGPGQAQFMRMPLDPLGGGQRLVGTLPPELSREGGYIEYYLDGATGQKGFVLGTPAAPFRVPVLTRAQIVRRGVRISVSQAYAGEALAFGIQSRLAPVQSATLRYYSPVFPVEIAVPMLPAPNGFTLTLPPRMVLPGKWGYRVEAVIEGTLHYFPQTGSATFVVRRRPVEAPAAAPKPKPKTVVPVPVPITKAPPYVQPQPAPRTAGPATQPVDPVRPMPEKSRGEAVGRGTGTAHGLRETQPGKTKPVKTKPVKTKPVKTKPVKPTPDKPGPDKPQKPEEPENLEKVKPETPKDKPKGGPAEKPKGGDKPKGKPEDKPKGKPEDKPKSKPKEDDTSKGKSGDKPDDDKDKPAAGKDEGDEDEGDKDKGKSGDKNDGDKGKSKGKSGGKKDDDKDKGKPAPDDDEEDDEEEENKDKGKSKGKGRGSR